MFVIGGRVQQDNSSEDTRLSHHSTIYPSLQYVLFVEKLGDMIKVDHGNLKEASILGLSI